MREAFGDEAVYALAARKLGLPVAFNTEERDQKMLASALRKKLGSLIKNGSGELSPKGGSNLSQTKTSAVIKFGYDIERLASDTKYYERALTAKPGDPAHMSLIESLADEGEALLDKKQKPKK
jgi:hypothetical protein